MKNENKDLGKCVLLGGIASGGGGPVEIEAPLALAAGVGQVLEVLCEACSCFVLCFRLWFDATALVEMSALGNEEGSHS